MLYNILMCGVRDLHMFSWQSRAVKAGNANANGNKNANKNPNENENKNVYAVEPPR